MLQLIDKIIFFFNYKYFYKNSWGNFEYLYWKIYNTSYYQNYSEFEKMSYSNCFQYLDIFHKSEKYGSKKGP